MTVLLFFKVFYYKVAILMYVLTELGYVLIYQVKRKKNKKGSFENALV